MTTMSVHCGEITEGCYFAEASVPEAVGKEPRQRNRDGLDVMIYLHIKK